MTNTTQMTALSGQPTLNYDEIDRHVRQGRVLQAREVRRVMRALFGLTEARTKPAETPHGALGVR